MRVVNHLINRAYWTEESGATPPFRSAPRPGFEPAHQFP